MYQDNQIIPEPAGDDMGRPPIHDAPMTPAERQRRRRARLNKEPWTDPRSLAWSVVGALRALRAEEGAPFDEAAMAALIDRAAEDMDVPADKAEEAIAALQAFLDPAQPLSERGPRRGGHGHGFGDRHRRRRERRRGHGGERGGERDDE